MTDDLKHIRERARTVQQWGRRLRGVPTVPCGHCEGTGRVHIPDHLARTADIVGVDWRATDSLHSAHTDGVQRTALINRLNKLTALGLVERRFIRGSIGMLEWRRTR